MKNIPVIIMVLLSCVALSCCWNQPTTCYVRQNSDLSSGLESLTTAVNNLQQTLELIADRLTALPITTTPPPTEIPTTMEPTTEVPTTTMESPPSHGCSGEGWRRVQFLDISQICPAGWQLTNYSIRTCGRMNTNTESCAFIFISTGGQYSEVCGRATGYRFGDPVAFASYHRNGLDIEGTYLDGISITHGTPRNHTWSFANGFFSGVSSDQRQQFSRCPCDPGNTYDSPSFVGDDFFCDSVVNEATAYTLFSFYPDNALWDGVDSLNSCYDEPGVPWFENILEAATTNDIEVRLCSSSPGDRETAINLLELYVR